MKYFGIVLPSGRHAGGAPFNVAAHLAQLGVSVSLISAVGRDPLGDEILEVAGDKKVNVDFVSRVRIGLPTGTVIATVDEKATRPTSWFSRRRGMRSKFPRKLWRQLRKRARSRSAHWPAVRLTILEQLDRLLAVKGPLKFFDVNLRPPFVDPELVMDLAKRADVIKLNDGEAGRLASWLRTGEATHEHAAECR